MTEEEQIEQRINRSFKAVGRKLSPTYNPGIKPQRNKIEEINFQSAESLKRIQARYGRPNSVPLRVTVDSHLRTHT